MALVAEIIARFRADTAGYTAGVTKAKVETEALKKSGTGTSAALANIEKRMGAAGMASTGLAGKAHAATSMLTGLGGGGEAAFLGMGSAASMGFAAAGVAVVGFAAMSVKAYNDAQKVAVQTNAVIASTKGAAGISAQGVGALASRLRDLSGVDDDVIQSMENVLLTFTNVQNVAGKGNDIFNQSTAAILDMSTALHQDLKSSAIQVGKALQDPITGLSALRRVGVAFTKTQQAMVKGWVEHGQTLRAQKFILAELNKEFGGSAKAMGTTLPGKLNILKSHFGDTMEGVGKAVSGTLPALIDVMGQVAAIIGPVLVVAFKILGVALNVVSAAIKLNIVYIKAILWPWQQLGKLIGWTADKLAGPFKKAMDLTRGGLHFLGGVIHGIIHPFGLFEHHADASAVAAGHLTGEAHRLLNTIGDPKPFTVMYDGALHAGAGLVYTMTKAQQMQHTLLALGVGLGRWAGRGAGDVHRFTDLTGQDFNTFSADAKAAFAKGGQAVTDFEAKSLQSLATWKAGMADSMNFVKGSLSGLASNAHLTANDIIKEFDRQLKAMGDYRKNWDIVANSGIKGSKDFLAAIAGMGQQGGVLLQAMASGNKAQMAKIIGDWNTAGGKSRDLATTIQRDLVGSIKDLIAAIQGIPGWTQRVDTSRAISAIDATWQDATKKGFIFVKHGGGIIDGEPDNRFDRALRPNEHPAVVEHGEFVVRKDRVPQNRNLLEAINSGHVGSWPRFHDGGVVAAAAAAFGRQAAAWGHTGRHLDASVDAHVAMDPSRWTQGGGSGGGSGFGGSGGVNGGWGYRGSPNALRYRAAVEAAWPALRFGGMYSRRFIRGTHIWSQHAYGNAIDEMTPSLPYGDQVYSWARARSGALSLAHLLWRVPDHFNHIHADFWPQGVGVPMSGGGIARARPGGVDVRIGEGGRDEAVIPLPTNWRSGGTGTGSGSMGGMSDRDAEKVGRAMAHELVRAGFGQPVLQVDGQDLRSHMSRHDAGRPGYVPVGR